MEENLVIYNDDFKPLKKVLEKIKLLDLPKDIILDEIIVINSCENGIISIETDNATYYNEGLMPYCRFRNPGWIKEIKYNQKIK